MIGAVKKRDHILRVGVFEVGVHGLHGMTGRRWGVDTGN